MPTETKNKIEKISRSGKVSSCAVTEIRFFDHHSGEECTECHTPKTLHQRQLTPQRATTVKVNSSREPKRTTSCMIQGTRRLPIISIKPSHFKQRVRPKVSHMFASGLVPAQGCRRVIRQWQEVAPRLKPSPNLRPAASLRQFSLLTELSAAVT